METKLVVGNWKMNMTNAEATANVQAFVKHVDARSDVDVVICPPYMSIGRVRELVKDTHIKVGAQDTFWENSGAYTGQVSAPMLAECDVTYCIVGHSEKRGRFGKLETDPETLCYFKETDHTVNLKLKSLLFHSINPILCVGETADERNANQTESVIEAQLRGALAGLDPAELYFFSVAYEPVWAIGTGNTCESGEANRVCGLIRRFLGEILDEDVASMIRILYGGSVKASNSRELFHQPNIDGGLVGGSSLDSEEFSKIVRSA